MEPNGRCSKLDAAKEGDPKEEEDGRASDMVRFDVYVPADRPEPCWRTAFRRGLLFSALLFTIVLVILSIMPEGDHEHSAENTAAEATMPDNAATRAVHEKFQSLLKYANEQSLFGGANDTPTPTSAPVSIQPLLDVPTEVVAAEPVVVAAEPTTFAEAVAAEPTDADAMSRPFFTRRQRRRQRRHMRRHIRGIHVSGFMLPGAGEAQGEFTVIGGETLPLGEVPLGGGGAFDVPGDLAAPEFMLTDAHA